MTFFNKSAATRPKTALLVLVLAGTACGKGGSGSGNRAPDGDDANVEFDFTLEELYERAEKLAVHAPILEAMIGDEKRDEAAFLKFANQDSIDQPNALDELVSTISEKIGGSYSNKDRPSPLKGNTTIDEAFAELFESGRDLKAGDDCGDVLKGFQYKIEPSSLPKEKECVDAMAWTSICEDLETDLDFGWSQENVRSTISGIEIRGDGHERFDYLGTLGSAGFGRSTHFINAMRSATADGSTIASTHQLKEEVVVNGAFANEETTHVAYRLKFGESGTDVAQLDKTSIRAKGGDLLDIEIKLSQDITTQDIGGKETLTGKKTFSFNLKEDSPAIFHVSVDVRLAPPPGSGKKAVDHRSTYVFKVKGDVNAERFCSVTGAN
jgi:hypothetical protein